VGVRRVACLRVPHEWKTDPVAATSVLAGPPGDEASWRAVDFASIASWVVDGLHYLVDVDGQSGDQRPAGYPAAQVEHAHARWAVSDAITAIDLCAAALGRLLTDQYPQGKWHQEMDFRDAEKLLKNDAEAGPWIVDVQGDPDSERLLAFRHAAVHRVMRRHATVSVGEGTVTSRWSASLTGGPQIDVGQLPAIARDFATRHVEAFLARAAAGGFTRPGAGRP
jgi:hypothetical protein